MVLANWMQSPVSNQPVDPNTKFADNDMNTWTNVQAGVAQNFAGGTWSLLRCQVTPRHIAVMFVCVGSSAAHAAPGNKAL